MNSDTLKALLNAVSAGKMPVGDAMASLKHLSVEDIGYAHIDHHRSLRKGFPEVIFGQNKTAEQIIGIMERMVPWEKIIIVTRVEEYKAEAIVPKFPGAEYHTDAKMICLAQSDLPVTGKGNILVISAGTSDIPVAKEAYLTARAMGTRWLPFMTSGWRAFTDCSAIRKKSKKQPS